MKHIIKNCSFCNNSIEYTLGEYNHVTAKNSNRSEFFCNKKCYTEYLSLKNTKIEVSCLNCNSIFLKRSSDIKSSPNHFCNRSCATSYNNKKYPKKKITRRCVVCQEPITNYKINRCNKHQEEYKNNSNICKLRTLKEFRDLIISKKNHPSWINSMVGNFNRTWNKNLLDLSCANCGYFKHVELCHIKSISSFSDEATLGEINSSDNVIQLCPNCHWELDHGDLTIEKIKK